MVSGDNWQCWGLLVVMVVMVLKGVVGGGAVVGVVVVVTLSAAFHHCCNYVFELNDLQHFTFTLFLRYLLVASFFTRTHEFTHTHAHL